MSNFELKQDLDGKKEVNPNYAYLIDFSKMQSVNDLILVLSSFGFSIQGNHPFIEQLKPFLNLDNPIDVKNGKQ